MKKWDQCTCKTLNSWLVVTWPWAGDPTKRPRFKLKKSRKEKRAKVRNPTVRIRRGYGASCPWEGIGLRRWETGPAQDSRSHIPPPQPQPPTLTKNYITISRNTYISFSFSSSNDIICEYDIKTCLGTASRPTSTSFSRKKTVAVKMSDCQFIEVR